MSTDTVTNADIRSTVDALVAGTSARAGRPPEHWPAEARAAFTDEALRVSVSYARRSPFYADKLDGHADPATAAELATLPFTYPLEVKGRFADLLACGWEDLAQVNLSSGTTAGPTTYVGYTASDLRGDGANYAHAGLFSFARTDVVAVALPYDMATVGLSIHRDVQRQGAVVLPAGKGGTYGPPERLVQAIAELGVTTLFSTPSFAWYLADLYEQTFPASAKPVRHLRVGGEGASPAMLAGLGRRWGADVRQWYGSTEIGVIAYSCELGNYHLAAANCHLEIVDGDDRPAAPGDTGFVVLTTLGRGGTPMIRYHSGDRAACPAEPCPCGRTLPVVRMYGRSTDQLAGLRGPVSPFLVEEFLMRNVPGAEPWYHLAVRDTGITLVAEWPDSAPDADRDGVAARILGQVAAAGGLELAAVQWAGVGTLDRPRTKMRRVRDERIEELG